MQGGAGSPAASGIFLITAHVLCCQGAWVRRVQDQVFVLSGSCAACGSGVLALMLRRPVARVHGLAVCVQRVASLRAAFKHSSAWMARQ